MLEVVKGSGNPKKMSSLVSGYISSAVKKINDGIQVVGADCIAFVPPTATRKIQVMRLLENEFADNKYHAVDTVKITRDFSGIRPASAGAETYSEC